ncbi:PerC family transcriptional regulator [Atlantibacter sp.]
MRIRDSLVDSLEARGLYRRASTSSGEIMML